MGVTTNAILAYGFDLGSEEDDGLPEGLLAAGNDGEGGFDFEKLVLAHVGLKAPKHTDYDSPEWANYWEAQREAVAAFPVTVEYHCSAEYTMHFLAVQGTVTKARRGYPAVVDIQDVKPVQVQALREFCERYGIEWSEPKWTLFSYWS